MKLFQLALLALAATISTASLKAQTADDIINKHNDAIGGKDVFAKVKSVYLEGNATAMGTDYPTSTTVLTGKGFKNVTSVNGADIIQCITDTSGWSQNPLAGQNDPTPMESGLVKKGQSSLMVGGELANYKALGYADSLAGRETINGVNTYKIQLSQPGVSTMYYIDPTTYYVVKTDSKVSVNGADVSSSTTYSNYKKTDVGYVVATTLGVTNMGYDVTINYTKIDVNKDVDPKIFAMPK